MTIKELEDELESAIEELKTTNDEFTEEA